MKDAELEAVADDICAAANNELLRQEKYTDQKWTLSDGKKALTHIDRIDFPVSLTVHSLHSHAAYIRLRKYLEGLDSVQAVIPIAGLHTQPHSLLDKLIKDAFVPSEQCFDAKQLLKKLSELITLFDSEFHDFVLAGRLHGVKLEIDSVELEPNVHLVRLDDNAINERQPYLSTSCELPCILDYSNSNVEIVIKDSYKITPHSESSYFRLVNRVEPELRLKLEAVVKAIRLYHHGDYQVYPALGHNPLFPSGGWCTTEPKYINPFKNVALGDADIDGLKRAFSIVKTVIPKDHVLARSFSRFLIAGDERMPEERIVDLVIAWESLLLTVNGNPCNSELSYRFSLNGAAVLLMVENSLEFTNEVTFMKNCYGLRSKVVHGVSLDSLIKTIRGLGFDSLDALNSRLSELYRKVLFWLATLEKKARPYNAQFGWELLLRKNQGGVAVLMS